MIDPVVDGAAWNAYSLGYFGGGEFGLEVEALGLGEFFFLVFHFICIYLFVFVIIWA
jgi:hypothetical protein